MNRDKGIALDGWRLKVVTIGENGVTEDDILTHDSHSDNLGLQMMLADMKWPDFPVALGVIREVPDITYEDEVAKQVEQASRQAAKDLDKTFYEGVSESDMQIFKGVLGQIMRNLDMI